MNKVDRSRHILNHINSLHPQFTKRDRTNPKRSVVSDDPRWEAIIIQDQHIEREATDTPQPMSCLMVYVFGQLRLTAHYSDEHMIPRLYKPGPWEPMFLMPESKDLTPLVPGVLQS